MYEYQAKVLNVVDGDTIDVLIDLGFDIHIKQRIRLYGVDTPETRTKNKKEKKKGLEAKQFVKNRIDDKTVLLTTNEKGKFGRYLATIWYQECGIDTRYVSINSELIENKLAKPYFGGKKNKYE